MYARNAASMKRDLVLLALLLCSAGLFAEFAKGHSYRPRFRPPPVSSEKIRPSVRADLLSKCQEKWRNATLDHFTFGNHSKGIPDTFRQRYFLCDTHWEPSPDGEPGPIFFYFGNEADVELYLNNTGLMWESAEDFGALLVFAEHRVHPQMTWMTNDARYPGHKTESPYSLMYYGRSKPFNKDDLRNHMGYLTAEQAMADYAGLIRELKRDLPGANTSAVIGFGGSYGGMLGSWFRMKYPHLVDGVIAASAPIWTFPGEVPEVDAGFFAKGATFDASEAGGSAPACVDNVRSGWQLLKKLGATEAGRAIIHGNMKLCSDAKLKDENSVIDLRNWLAGAWDTMAMGNFPYPSGYILSGIGELPAFPVRVACSYLKHEDPTDKELLAGMAAAAAVFYNHSGDLACLDYRSDVNPESSETNDFWGYQYCTEMFQLFARDGVSDMFWDEPFDAEAVSQGCFEQWGVRPRQQWASQEWGGRRIEAHSNIVFSNGLLDPWHGGGVLLDVSDTIVALIIPEGAHHLDLMFSNPEDPQSVIEVRDKEREWIQIWIDEARENAPFGRRSRGHAARARGDRSGMTQSSASGMQLIWGWLGLSDEQDDGSSHRKALRKGRPFKG